MAEKMSREQEQAALAAADKGDVFAMYDLFVEYKERKSLFNKNSNEEKAKTWCLEAAEGGYIKAMKLAVTYYSRDRSKYDWIDTYIRALDLLLRKYKAIYFEDDRKEEARTILSYILDMTHKDWAYGDGTAIYDGRTISFRERYHDAVMDIPEYEDDYEIAETEHPLKYRLNSWALDDLREKYRDKEMIVKYTLVRPDHMDALEKEIEELENNLYQRMEAARNARLSPTQELFGFSIDDRSLESAFRDYYIPNKSVIKVIDDFKILPNMPWFEGTPYVEGCMYSKEISSARPIPIINLAGYLNDGKWEDYDYYEQNPKYMIILKMLDPGIYGQWDFDYFAIPAVSTLGTVVFPDDKIYRFDGKFDTEKGISFAIENGRQAILVDLNALIEKVGLKNRLDKGMAELKNGDSYVKNWDKSVFDICDNGYDSASRGVVTVMDAGFNDKKKRVIVTGRIVKGTIHKGDTVSYYDMAVMKNSKTFHVEGIDTIDGKKEEAGLYTMVTIITDQKDLKTPWDWHVKTYQELLLKVK